MQAKTLLPRPSVRCYRGRTLTKPRNVPSGKCKASVAPAAQKGEPSLRTCQRSSDARPSRCRGFDFALGDSILPGPPERKELRRDDRESRSLRIAEDTFLHLYSRWRHGRPGSSSSQSIFAGVVDQQAVTLFALAEGLFGAVALDEIGGLPGVQIENPEVPVRKEPWGLRSASTTYPRGLPARLTRGVDWTARKPAAVASLR